MQLMRFDRDVATPIEAHGTSGASQVKFGNSRGEAHLNAVFLEAGGVLGAHEAPIPQPFLVVAGEGWVVGEGGDRREVRAGGAVLWGRGEMHETGTDSGMTAVIMQALELELAATGL